MDDCADTPVFDEPLLQIKAHIVPETENPGFKGPERLISCLVEEMEVTRTAVRTDKHEFCNKFD